ncbi:hypothetical protein CN918_30530 [Priestia megaterium]|nr:hypothetical protein CN918_30530 [Priestia megaterium]
MKRADNTPFNEADYLVKLAGILVQKNLATFTDLSEHDSNLVSDIISACFDKNLKILDDIVEAKPSEKTRIYYTLSLLVTNGVITVRQLVMVHKKLGIEIGKYMLRRDKFVYHQMKESGNHSPESLTYLKKTETYQDLIRIAVNEIIDDIYACNFLANLVRKELLDMEGLELLDYHLGENVKDTLSKKETLKTSMQHSSIHLNSGLITILVLCFTDLGIELDDISSAHPQLGSRVGAVLFSKGVI